MGPMTLRPSRWRTLAAVAVALLAGAADAQDHSVARAWNEVTLDAIRTDLARPTVHARNLFHASVAMYDAWAAYDDAAAPYLVGRSLNAVACDASPDPPTDRQAAREEAMSYAAYRLLVWRFRNSPGAILSLPTFDALMAELGYDPAVTTTEGGSPAALGNTIGACLIAYGRVDGANEALGYEPLGYQPVNPPLDPAEPGNPDIVDLNRWQPLSFDVFVDQSGNEFPGGVPAFVGPEWGAVRPFALDPAGRTFVERDGQAYTLYGTPGGPPLWQPDGGGGTADYLWGFGLVAEWSGHLDPADGERWDISPATLGDLRSFPDTPEAVRQFYRDAGEGAIGTGHAVNPATGQPYAPNVVARGDYTRVLAEFWADGPDSETPPGHWYTLLNTVSDHPDLVKRWAGEGPVLDDLEWDVKTYLALGGAVHDAAVTAWGLKGWYDYIRPVSAIRAVAALGQSSEPGAPDYHPGGLGLTAGVVERIGTGDPLAGAGGQFVGDLKIWGWRGPDAIDDPEVDEAGVGWVRAAEWWPYQRPTFVTPPFAGYVSGHSTFSRAAAEVLTRATGDPFFPGGMGEFVAPANEFLVFEEGPSETITLQWATYRDAADQCSLSRIWGGIHPPADDLPGRILGIDVGLDAVAYAEELFAGRRPVATEPAPLTPALTVSPSPVRAGRPVAVRLGTADGAADVLDVRGRRVATLALRGGSATLDTHGLAPGLYVVRARAGADVFHSTLSVVR